MLRAPDDGTGTGTTNVLPPGVVDPAPSVVVPPVVTAPGVVASPVTPAAPANSVVDNTFDGLILRVSTLESENAKLGAEIDDLRSAKPVASANDPATEDRLVRLEKCLGPPFGREFAEYDAAELAKNASNG